MLEWGKTYYSWHSRRLS